MSGLAAIGLLLTTATQFRLSGLPVGPGEAFLLLWIGASLIQQTYRSGSLLTPAFSWMLTFWAVFAVAESIGALTGYVIGYPHDSGLFLHDVMAYPLMAAFSCLSLAGPEAASRLNRTAWTLVTVGAACLVPMLAAGWGLTDLPFMSPWFGDRFRGWSNNPNQLAFLCALLVLITLHLADRATQWTSWVLAVLCFMPAYFVGRLTKTDTFTFAILAGAAVFPVIKIRFWFISARFGHVLRPRLAILAVIGLPLTLVAFSPFLMSVADDPQALAAGMMKNGGKEAKEESALRLQLWGEAFDRGVQSGLLGLGPGPHLPIPVSIIGARNQERDLDTGDHPAVNGLPNFEAHNTFLDLFTQGGLLAVLCFASLVATGAISSYRARLAGLVAIVTGLFMFALTDLIVREPIFWFGIALSLVACNSTARAGGLAGFTARRRAEPGPGAGQRGGLRSGFGRSSIR